MQPTAEQIEKAKEFMTERVAAVVADVLGHPTNAVRAWVEGAELRDLVDLDNTPPSVSLAAVPLLLLDLALAELRRDHGLTEEQSEREYERIKGELLRAWPGVFNATGEVEVPSWEIDLPGGVRATVNPISRAMDEIEDWMGPPLPPPSGPRRRTNDGPEEGQQKMKFSGKPDNAERPKATLSSRGLVTIWEDGAIRPVLQFIREADDTFNPVIHDEVARRVRVVGGDEPGYLGVVAEGDAECVLVELRVQRQLARS